MLYVNTVLGAVINYMVLLGYHVKIKAGCLELIGASLSEPHTNESFGTINHVQTNMEISD